jgi:hypothetical protein
MVASRVERIGVLGTAFLAACGGRVAGDSADTYPPPPRDAVSVFDSSLDGPLPAILGPVNDVSEGWVLVGSWYRDDSTHTVKPEESCDDDRPTTFWVSAYRLMRLEVTNGQYLECVLQGSCIPTGAVTDPPWDSPDAGDLPVEVDYDGAQTFCRTYGGDLPTTAEWWRALEGDELGAFGIAQLTNEFLACLYDDAGPWCGDLHVHDPPPLVAVGSHVWDVGPFGHSDLYGNAPEWLRMPVVWGSCLIGDFSADPATFLPVPADANLANVGEMLWALNPPAPPDAKTIYLPDGEGRVLVIGDSDSFSTPSAAYMGFRCAFPPVVAGDP